VAAVASICVISNPVVSEDESGACDQIDLGQVDVKSDLLAQSAIELLDLGIYIHDAIVL
jgi:hypothetical protein